MGEDCTPHAEFGTVIATPGSQGSRRLDLAGTKLEEGCQTNCFGNGLIGSVAQITYRMLALAL